MARQRRFAGQVEAFEASTPGAFGGMTETLKAAGQFLKPSRGGRLGSSTATEQQEGTAARLANPQVFQPVEGAQVQDVAKLRKDLGIDDLIKSVSQLRESQNAAGQTYPKLEMPEFKWPSFAESAGEITDFFNNLVSNAYDIQEQGTAGETQQQTEATPPQQTPATGPATGSTQGQTNLPSRIAVGNLSYNLGKFGGAGLGSKDVKALLAKGASRKTLAEFATKAPGVSQGALRLLRSEGIKPAASTDLAAGISKTFSARIKSSKSGKSAGKKR